MAIVGIDLGTTNSLVAYLSADGPVTIPNELGDHLTPSVVAFAEDGALLVGRAARDRLVVAPSEGRAFFKRDMGTDTRYEFGGKSWTPTELSAAVLLEMKRIAAAHLHEAVDRAVITVPAYFHDPERQATVEAAKIAGLKVERILNEPTAAALAFGYRAGPEPKKVLVFDLGGGTFDVTILEIFEGVIEVCATGGDSRLGGEDYTEALVDLVLGKAGVAVPAVERASLRQRLEVVKRRLAAEDRAEVQVRDRTIPVSRAEFETATAPITARIRPVVLRCLRDAGVAPAELDDVLLVGGASRMPLVHTLIGATLERLGNRSLDPDRVVALGAAVQAARCDRSEAVRELMLTDVCAHTLGVEVSNELTPGELKGGYFLPIIERNTTIPISRSVPLETLHPQQDVLALRVYQGENRRVEGNTLLGTLEVRGLRVKPGQTHPGMIECRFSYDGNGILEVEVTVLETGVTLSKVIESRPGAMTPAQLAEALRRLVPLKTHPRNLLPNRARLERADRLYAELLGEARRRLSLAIADFEQALATQDAERVAFTGAVLDQLCERYAAEDERQGGPDEEGEPEASAGADEREDTPGP